MHDFRRVGTVAVAAAALLGVSAWFTHRMARRAEQDNPPRGKFVDVDGIRLHYLEHGPADAPALVLLHGLGSMAHEIELSGLVERAARDFHVFVFDRPGYGHSDRPVAHSYTPQAQSALLVSAMRALGIRRPVVLGHSWGSLVAHAMAQDFPAEIAAVVLASGYHTPSLRLDTFFLSPPALPVLGTLMRHTIAPLIGRLMWPLMVRRIFAPAPTTAAFASQYPVWMQLRPTPLRASAAETAMLTLQAVRLRARDHLLAVPVVLVAGEKDRLVMTFWHSGRMHKRLANAPLRIVPGAGHMVHHTAPDAVMQAIREAHQMAGTHGQ